MRFALVFILVALPAWAQKAASGEPRGDARSWFQATEQELMDALGSGNKAPWERVMDDGCVITDEEGHLQSKAEFLADLRPLPAGLAGGIAVKELTVQEFPTFAVVRYLSDEWETAFGQRIATKYRVTDTYRRDGASWKLVALALAVVTADPPAQPVPAARLAGLAGTYQLAPGGWKFHVVVKDGKLLGGRDPHKLRPMVPVTPTAFVQSGSLGEWLFDLDDKGRATRIVDLRKFETLVWTRVPD